MSMARYALAITLPEALEVSLPAVEEVEAQTEHNRCVADWGDTDDSAESGAGGQAG